MTATVRLPAALVRYAGGSGRIRVEAAETVGDAIAAASSAHPDLGERLVDAAGRLRPHLSAAVGDRIVTTDEPLAPGEEVVILVAIAGGAEDVRMRGFRRRASVEEALAAALHGVGALDPETVPAAETAGRVLAADAVSEVAVPPFRRATMDGYAVRATETYGASAYAPVSLVPTGESMPGAPLGSPLGPGEACRIMTGAPVPEGADAVVRAEDASEAGGRVLIAVPVPEGRNVGRVGEDVTAGDVVLRTGRRLRPQDVGVLVSIGHGPVPVVRRPLVRVIVSGDELLPPGARPAGQMIVDSNGPMLTALIERDGGLVEPVRLPDGREPMRSALAAPGADVIVTAGAASVGREDHVPILVAELGDLAVHGVAMRPSSPSGVGRIGAVPVLILPGNPVSCLVAYDAFAGPVIRTMAGRSPGSPYPVERHPMTAKVVSQIGRTDYLRVIVVDGGVAPLAISGASVLTSTTRADGFVVVPAGSEGFPEGTVVAVHRYDGAAS